MRYSKTSPGGLCLLIDNDSGKPARGWRSCNNNSRFDGLYLRVLVKKFKLWLLLVTLSVVCMILWLSSSSYHPKKYRRDNTMNNVVTDVLTGPGYPLTQVVVSPDNLWTFRLAVVADLDSHSREADGRWKSFYKRGDLTWDPRSRNVVQIDWTDEIELSGTLAQNQRGMELSELTVFNGRLLTVDDRTGVIYEIHLNDDGTPHHLSPWVIMADGDGSKNKGFKAEWMTVRHGYLYVGGLGKEWTSPDGKTVINHDPMFIKRISADGKVEHLDWKKRYEMLKEAVGIQSPGYLIHESCAWSSHRNEWIFLPRRASKKAYHEDEDERQGTNFLIRADDGFNNLPLVTTVGTLTPTRGFSSVKFIPGTKDNVIIALKSEEINGKAVASYVTVIDLHTGKVLYPETNIGKYKYEGIEFV